jgi:molecular chaperone DnaK
MRETAPFEIVDSQNGDARVRVQGRVYSPPELSGIVLQRLKAAAEDYVGESIADAIITVRPILTIPSVRPPRTPAKLRD